jgi:hypothetical protein
MYDKSRQISHLLKQGVINALNNGYFEDEYIKFVKHLGYLQGHIGDLVEWNLLHPILFYFGNENNYYIKLIDGYKDVYIYINEFRPSYVVIKKDGKELSLKVDGELSDELEEYIYQLGTDMQLDLKEIREEYEISYDNDSGF